MTCSEAERRSRTGTSQEGSVNGPVAQGLRAKVQGIAEELDARYLDLYDEEKPGGRTPGWEAAFRRDRAAASALDHDPRLAASGALYEASYALDEDLIPLAGEVA